jgi:hypothetical protein
MAENIEELTQRIQRMEDMDGVRRTFVDYLIHFDSRRYDKLAQVFTEDAILEMVGLAPVLPGDGTYHGRKSIMSDFFGSRVKKTARTGHFGTNLRVELDRDEATSVAYFWEIIPGIDGKHHILVGTYQHRMRRERDRWRIAYLRISVTFRSDLPATEIWGRPIGEVFSEPV